MKKLDKIIKLIKQKAKEFNNASLVNFNDVIKKDGRPIRGKFEFPGIYIIYEKNNGMIYIGMAGKGDHFLRYRLSDLFFYDPKRKKFKHSLTQKLLTKIRRFKNINGIADFYRNRCYLKVIGTKSAREARIIEDIFIELLSPKYNQE